MPLVSAKRIFLHSNSLVALSSRTITSGSDSSVSNGEGNFNCFDVLSADVVGSVDVGVERSERSLFTKYDDEFGVGLFTESLILGLFVTKRFFPGPFVDDKTLK